MLLCVCYALITSLLQQIACYIIKRGQNLSGQPKGMLLAELSQAHCELETRRICILTLKALLLI